MEFQRQLKKTNQTLLFNLALIGILVLLYTPLLLFWVDGWLQKNISTEHEYFSHGIIGLPLAAYLAWLNRKKWQRLPDYIHPLGGIFILVAGVFYLSGVMEWVNLSFPFLLAGLCLWLKGIPGLRLQGFPLILVFFATPNSVPYLISPYSLPLESFIAGAAGFLLTEFGMQVQVYGIDIYAGNRVVEVAPYCAGLKMLFTTLYVSLILLYWTGALSDRRKTLWFLFCASLISVTGNIIRNTLLAYFHGTGQEKAFLLLHQGWGGDVYSAVTLLILIPVLNWIDDYLTIPVEMENREESAKTDYIR